MAAADDKTATTLRDELAELLLAQARKRNEVSNLKVGYIRAVEGSGLIPPEPLRHNLVAARTQLTTIEQRLAELRGQLGLNDQPEVLG